MSDRFGPGDRRARLRHRLRQQSAQRTVRIAAISAAATLVVLAVILGGWRAYSEWRLGRIELTNRGPVATVRVLGERSDEPIVEPFEVVKSYTLALPDGDYRLRIDAEGRLGRTCRVAVNRGETVKHRITLEEGRLLGRVGAPRDRSHRRRQGRADRRLFFRAARPGPRPETLVVPQSQAKLLGSSALVAAGWIAFDVRTMPPPGHYDRADWALVLAPGAAVAGMLIILGWIPRRPMRWLMRPRRPAGAA